jgi:hypothetical protein
MQRNTRIVTTSTLDLKVEKAGARRFAPLCMMLVHTGAF